MTRCTSVGPTTARIALVGEAPGKDEEEAGIPFVGSSGYELTRMLRDARLVREECYITNVVMERPPGNDIDLWINPKKGQRDGEILYRGKWVKPSVAEDCDRLYTELRALKPNVIVALGNTPLWALTPFASVFKYRGSLLDSDALPGTKVIPAFHPAFILRQYEARYITVQDLRRVREEAAFPEIRRPAYRFLVNLSFQETIAALKRLIDMADLTPEGFDLVCDLEIKRTEILCVGLAWSKLDALCIPFYHPGGFRWTPEEHTRIVLLLQRLLLHPNTRLCNQNVSFDIQFLFWRFNCWPKAHFDTMLAQHVLFPGSPKDLWYLASMHCEYYRIWESPEKFWERPITSYPTIWEYNCLDCVNTYEVMVSQRRALAGTNLLPQFEFQMGRLFHPVMKMQLRGVRVNEEKKRPILKELETVVSTLTKEAEFLAGMPLTGEKGGFSSYKLPELFYNRLGLPKQYNRKGGVTSVTCDDEALKKLGDREPLVKPLVQRINMARSYATAVTACRSRVDSDGRWRTAYNMGGANTFRFSSSENPFNSGLNLQNLTVGKEITV